MRKSKLPKPTEAELSILRVLWRQGPSTVREIWEQINPGQQTGYTTVLKISQIMVEKGLLERVFSGSACKLVMQALAVKKATPTELAEIRKLLDQLEEGGKE